MDIPTTIGYIKAKQRNWEILDREGRTSKKVRSHFISTIETDLRCSRKYANKLLTGYVTYKGRKGRGKTYKEPETRLLRAVWQAVGGLCAPYLKAA